MKRGAQGETGFALISALLIVVAITAISVLLLERATRSRQRQSQVQAVLQTKAYLDGYENFVLAALDADLKNSASDHSAEAWATPRHVVAIDQGQAGGSIRDLQGRFNLNWLAGGDAVFGPESFSRLMAEAGLPAQLGKAIVQWLSESGPADRAPYRNRARPIDPRGGTAGILDELRDVAGMDAATFRRLQAISTVIPAEGTININTAPGAVLRAVLPELAPGTISALMDERTARPFASDAAFVDWITRSVSEITLAEIDLGRFSVSSNWFEAQIFATFHQTQLRRRLILYRSPETGKTRVRFRLSSGH